MCYDFMCFTSTIIYSRPALSPTNNINSGIFRNPVFVNRPWSLDLSKDIMFYKLVYFLITQNGDITLETGGLYYDIFFKKSDSYTFPHENICQFVWCGSGSRKYIHFWQEIQTEKVPKQKEHIIHNVEKNVLYLPPFFSNFHHCRNCMNYVLMK